MGVSHTLSPFSGHREKGKTSAKSTEDMEEAGQEATGVSVQITTQVLIRLGWAFSLMSPPCGPECHLFKGQSK